MKTRPAEHLGPNHNYSLGHIPHYTVATQLKVEFTTFMQGAKPPSLAKVLASKRSTAKRAVRQILNKNRDVELVLVFGSVADGSVTGWSSDIDLLAIVRGTNVERSEQIIVDRQPVFVDYFSLDHLKRYLEALSRRTDVPTFIKMANLRRFSTGKILYQHRRVAKKYRRIVMAGIGAFWRRAREGREELLDDFGWYYIGAREALRYGLEGVAAWRLQQALESLIKERLIDRRVLLRKFYPDDRGLRQLRELGFPNEFVELVRESYGSVGRSLIAKRLSKARKYYVSSTRGRKWLGTLNL